MLGEGEKKPTPAPVESERPREWPVLGWGVAVAEVLLVVLEGTMRGSMLMLVSSSGEWRWRP
jgi:hypothetical protein